MSLRRRLNHLASIYRPVATEDKYGDLGDVTAGDALILDAPCYLYVYTTPKSRESEDTGAGDASIVHNKIIFLPDVDLQMHDIVVLTAGPNAGRIFRIINPPNNVVGHHIEVIADEYNGPLEI